MTKWLQAGALLTAAEAARFAAYHFHRARLDSPATKMAVQRLLLLPRAELNGKTQSLSRQHGKILVQNSWATWCPPYREQIPALKKHKKYAGKSVEIVDITAENAVKIPESAAATRSTLVG